MLPLIQLMLLVTSASFPVVHPSNSERNFFKQPYYTRASSRESSSVFDARIIGGEGVGRGLVAHQLLWTDDGLFSCGASFVDVYDLHIAITATHCLWTGNPRSDSVISHEKIVVTAGKKLLSYDDFKWEQNRTVTKIVPYPGYYPTQGSADISIMFLDSNFKLSTRVKPVRIPDHDWDLPKKVHVSGWGSLEYLGEFQDELQYITLPVITDHSKCKQFDQIFRYLDITENEFCVGRTDGKEPREGSCQGDSGGPAVAYNASADDVYLVGIVSYAMTRVCGNSWAPTLYTRISKYTDWIRHEVGKYKNGMDK